ncbi:hypothetical protein H9657_10880 [Cellulomonas sp. Sa3CUA2]|uniref:Polyketide cyclase n=1 Tax=Cellulomonas avistercoris TaxID=2762242 RepID=A0ABR8QEH9_9CELL|nr:hypothetical protein [Cellulomonas avistercoris]MBD7918775.1 hypothetical protein [Cellulomonas avistercoris]
MSTLWTASWKPGWYNLDQTLVVGRSSAFAFSLPGPQAGPGHELAFATSGEWKYWKATVVAVENARFGPVREVDTMRFGMYTFRFEDGRWVTIETEQWIGALLDASPGFPVDDFDEEWANTGGWDLRVTLTDVEGPVSREAAGSIMRAVAEEISERDSRRAPG